MASVIKEQDMTCTGEPFGNPVRVVLIAELLVFGCAAPIGGGVSPAVEEIAGRAGRFRCGGVVVDDPDLVEGGTGDEDVIELGVVVDAVEVEPVGGRAIGGIVDVDAVGMVGDDAVVGECRVEVLHEVVDGAPLPDDFCVVVADGLDLDDGFGPEAVVDLRGVAPEGDGLVVVHVFPGDEQEVAVGQGLHVVMSAMVGRAVVIVVPEHVAVPVEQTEITARTTTTEWNSVFDSPGFQEGAVFKQINTTAKREIIGPCVDGVALPVE